MSEKKHKSKEKRWYLRVDICGACLFILISVGLAITYIVIASKRTLTPLEGTMFQFFILGLGTMGSFLFGKQSAKQTAKDLIKPHARSAFRRLIFLYESLSRLAKAIEKGKEEENSVANNNLVLEKLEAIVIEQIATADDALEDWRDIVPEDVEELTDKFSKVRNDNE